MPPHLLGAAVTRKSLARMELFACPLRHTGTKIQPSACSASLMKGFPPKTGGHRSGLNFISSSLATVGCCHS